MKRAHILETRNNLNKIGKSAVIISLIILASYSWGEFSKPIPSIDIWDYQVKPDEGNRTLFSVNVTQIDLENYPYLHVALSDAESKGASFIDVILFESWLETKLEIFEFPIYLRTDFGLFSVKLALRSDVGHNSNKQFGYAWLFSWVLVLTLLGKWVFQPIYSNNQR